MRILRRLARHLSRIGFELFAECEKFVLRLYPMYLSNIASRTFEHISMCALFAAPKPNHVHGSHSQIAGRFVRSKEKTQIHTVQVWNELRTIHVSHNQNSSSCITCLAKVDFFFFGQPGKNSNTLDIFTLPLDLKKNSWLVYYWWATLIQSPLLTPTSFRRAEEFRNMLKMWWTTTMTTSLFTHLNCFDFNTSIQRFLCLFLTISGQNPSYPRWSWIRKRIASKSKYLIWIVYGKLKCMEINYNFW